MAQHHLSEDKLGLLNLVVDQYLSFAEAQAGQKKVMSMTAWIDKLHAFMELVEKEILQGAGQGGKRSEEGHQTAQGLKLNALRKGVSHHKRSLVHQRNLLA